MFNFFGKDRRLWWRLEVRLQFCFFNIIVNSIFWHIIFIDPTKHGLNNLTSKSGNPSAIRAKPHKQSLGSNCLRLPRTIFRRLFHMHLLLFLNRVTPPCFYKTLAEFEALFCIHMCEIKQNRRFAGSKIMKPGSRFCRRNNVRVAVNSYEKNIFLCNTPLSFCDKCGESGEFW